jgi:hypothetical protein
MDGYALNLKEEQINISGGTTFKITDRIPAGSTGNTLLSNNSKASSIESSACGVVSRSQSVCWLFMINLFWFYD